MFPRDPGHRYYPDTGSEWVMAFADNDTYFLKEGARRLDSRRWMHYNPVCVTPAMALTKPGAGTVLREHAVVRRYTRMGRGNMVDSYACLGGLPQDLNFDPNSLTYLRIGDYNVFREGVTLSRATGEGNATVVGNHTYWMAQSHVGHNAVVGDRVVMVNGSALGGYAQVGDGAILSAHVVVHQFCRIGDLVMGQGNAAVSCHVPPYVIFGKGVNHVMGLNSVGLRRAEHITREDRRQVKEAFRMTYQSGRTLGEALKEMDACTDWGEVAGKFGAFIRYVLTASKPYRRPVCPLKGSRGFRTIAVPKKEEELEQDVCKRSRVQGSGVQEKWTNGVLE